MSDDAPADPSLLLVQHDTAHREHRHHDHRDLHHQHHRFHKRDAAAGTGVVTEIIATVSVVQQIDVDSAGNTYSTLLHPTSPPSSLALTDILTDGATHVSSDASTASGVTSHAASAATPPSTLLSSIDSAQSPLHASSDASAPTATHSSTFASTHVPVNSTSLISDSQSPSLSATLSSTFSNSTSSSSITSSLTYLTSSGASTSLHSSSTSSFSSFSTSSSSTSFSSTSSSASTSNGAIIAGGTAALSGASPSSTTSAGDQSSASNSSAPSTPVIVGSVVSGVAGTAIILLALVFIWRWRKKNRDMLPLGGDADTIRGADPSQPAPLPSMAQRASTRMSFIPAALANITGYKRASQRTEHTVSSTAGSERGFYKVSGRKLNSVLQTGGDGYGDDSAIRNPNTMSGTSFYQDSDNRIYGGPGRSVRPESGVVVIRPSPARTPVTEQGPFHLPTDSEPPLLRRPDALGRSHPSQDGSHGSRFREDV